MEQTKPIGHVIAGLIVGGAIIILYLLSGAAGASMGRDWLPILILLGGIILFTNLYGKSHAYQKSFGELFSYGFKTTIIITLTVVAFIGIMASLSPEMKTKALEASRKELERQGDLSDREIDTYINGVSKYFWLITIAVSMLFYIVLGAIASLIGAAVTRKRPKTPFDQLSI